MLHHAADDAWDTIEQHGEMTLEQRARLRLASTWAIQSRARCATRSSTWSARSPFSKKIRSNGGCATSTRLRNRARDGNFTTRRLASSCWACRLRTIF
jgi:hypothetical protein